MDWDSIDMMWAVYDVLYENGEFDMMLKFIEIHPEILEWLNQPVEKKIINTEIGWNDLKGRLKRDGIWRK